MSLKNTIAKTSFITLMALAYTGCSTEAAKAIQPEIELAEHSEVTFNINKYTDGLDNLNELLHLYNDETINLSVNPVQNMTGGAGAGALPADITMMVNSALNEIGEKVVLYANTENIGDVSNFYIIQGAITEYDVLESSSAGVNAALHMGKGRGEADMDAGASDDNQVAKITLDFNAIDGLTGRYVPKVRTSNSIKVQKVSASNEFGFSILGSGFGINASASKEQGKHAAIRLLVDLSMIELIGKLQKKPYWLCVPGAKKDSRLFRDIKRNFTKLSDEEQRNAIVSLLDLVGMPTTYDSIVQYKKENRIMPVDQSITSELYVSLLESAHKAKQQSLISSDSKKSFNNLL